MNICSGTGKPGSAMRHDEVAHEGIDCPVCAAIEAKLSAEEKLAEAVLMMERSERIVRNLEQANDELRDRIGVLEAPDAMCVLPEFQIADVGRPLPIEVGR